MNSGFKRSTSFPNWIYPKAIMVLSPVFSICLFGANCGVWLTQIRCIKVAVNLKPTESSSRAGSSTDNDSEFTPLKVIIAECKASLNQSFRSWIWFSASTLVPDSLIATESRVTPRSRSLKDSWCGMTREGNRKESGEKWNQSKGWDLMVGGTDSSTKGDKSCHKKEFKRKRLYWK